MSSVLLTLGYGRTNKEDFLGRFKLLQESYELITVLDVRKTPGSRNGRWCYAGEGMEQTLSEIGVGYKWLEYLGNRFPGTKKGLAQYSKWLHADAQRHIIGSFEQELKHIYGFGSIACLLCTERQPWIIGRSYPNCHRVILGEYIEKWSPIIRTIHAL